MTSSDPKTVMTVSGMNEIDKLTWTTRHAVADAFERLLVLSLYLYLAWRLLFAMADGRGFVNLLLLVSEGLVVAFLLVRRPAFTISTNWIDWTIALAATLCPLLVNPSDGPALVPVEAGVLLLVMGLVIQAHAKITLGRSFGCVPAHRGLKLAGPYRFVRHPMYGGYLISHVAFLLINPTFRNAVVYTVTSVLQISRILAEERLLSCDSDYRRYRHSVRYRMIPGIF